MSVWSRIKRWFTGGGGGSSSSRSSSRSSSSNRSSTKRASRVTNYGGGGSRSVRNYNSRTRRYYEDREAEQQTPSVNTETRQQRTTNALASISKRTDALSSGNSISNYADSKKSGLDKAVSQAGTGNGTTRALAKIAEKTAERTKANPPDAKLKQSQIKDAKTIRRDTSKALKEFTEADYEKNTNALIKSGDYERMPRAKNMNTPSAENRADLRVTPQGLERRMQDPAYKRLLSASRGAAGGSTWLATNVLLAGDKNDEYDREMERVYQKNKSHGAEIAGELVGTLASFGIGAGPTQTLAKNTGNVALKAGGKAVGKVIGKDVGELTVERGAQWAAEKLANNPLTRKAAEKELKLAIKKGLVNGADDIAKNEYIQKFAAKRATKLVNALGAEAALNLTGVAMMDVNRASLEHEIGSDEWWDELKRAAKTNAALSSVIVVAPALRARGGLPFVGGVRKDTKELLANLAKNGDSPTARQAMREAFAREGDDAGKRIDFNELLSKNSPFRQADDVIRPQNVDEAVERAATETVERNADDAARETINNNVENARPQNLDDVAEQTARETGENTNRNALRLMDLETGELIDESASFTDVRDRLEAFEFKIRNGESLSPSERTWLEAVDNAINPHTDDVEISARTATLAINADNLSRRLGIPYEDAVDRVLLRENLGIARNRASEESQDILLDAIRERNRRGMRDAAGATNPEPPRPTVNESSGKIPTEEVRKMQTREESEKLMQDYFNEYGEADLGKYGKITQVGDDEYKVAIEGVGEETITREEAEKRIHNAVKRAYRDSRQVNDIGEVTNAQKEHVTMRQKINNMLKYLHMELVDSLHPYENLERGRAKAAKRQVNYGPIDALRRYMTTANYSAGTKQLKINNDAYDGIVKSVGADGKEYAFENGKSLKDIFKGMDKETEHDFNTYLLSKHAPYRLLQDKPVFEGIVDKAERDFDDAQVCMETAERLLKKHPEFAERAEWIYQYARNELNNRVEAGLLKQEVVDDWLRKYPYYVPTGRDGFNEIHGVISGNTVSADGLKTASGSSFDIRSIRDQLENATTRNWRDISTNNLFRDMFGDRIAAELAEEADGGVQMVLDNSVLLHRHENRYFADIFDHEGNKHAVEIGEEYYKGLNDLYKNGRIGVALVDTLNDVFGKVSGVWKKLITEWSPIFMVTNGMKDAPEAILNSKQTREYIRCIPRALKDLATGGEYSTALKRMGISQSTFVDLEKAIAAKETGENLLLRANAAVELFPRLTEFMATFEKEGIPLKDASIELRQRAAANAADVTVNFGRSGSVGKLLNRGYVPFFNPSMQGWSKFVRNFSEQPTSKSFLKYITMATVLGNAPNTINNFVLRNNPNYQMISARDKATNYIIPVTNGDATIDTTDTFVKIPKARFISVMGEPTVNAFNENKMGWAEAFKIANGQVGPVDPLESTLFRPFKDAKNNETWYGSPIVSKGIENKTNPSQEYDENTTYLGRALGKTTENMPTPLQISPKRFDYVLDQETGIVGDVAMPMMTPGKQGSGNIFGETDSPALNFVGETAAKLIPPALSPVKKAFVIDSTTRNDLSSRFYDQLQIADDNKDLPNATEEDAAEYKRLNAYSTEASDLTKAIKEMQGSNRPDKQEAVRGLQKVRNQLMLDALNGNDVPAKAKTVDAVQKYVGTSYAISNFGSSSDKEAMKVYGLAKYGKLSDEDMAKRIDADKDFYKGVQAIGNLEDQAAKSGVKTNTTLSKAVALASIGASDDLYGAYAATKKSRTESADKMTRAKTYMSTGGSTNEFVKLESARKSLGKLSDYDKEAELDKINDQLAKGEISQDEYYTKQGEINYNANISYVGLATSLAEANAPERGYRLYDIKDKNIQKGINLAAMGYTARDYREMAKAVDANGNGYPSKQEIVDYVANSDVEDKATLFDALYYYKSSKNPFGTPTNYTREQAAAAGKAKGVKAITDETGDISLKAEESSSKSGYSKGYRRRGYRRRGYRSYSGSSAKATVPKPKAIKATSFAKGEALVSSTRKSSSAKKTNKVTPPQLKRVQAKIDLPTKR